VINIPIEKGIPIPPNPREGGHGNTKYPFRAMEVGDSIFIPCTLTELPGVRNRVHSATRHYTKNGITFTSRTVEGGFRVWRIK
jgi:hypothetical protein